MSTVAGRLQTHADLNANSLEWRVCVRSSSVLADAREAVRA